MGKFNGFLLASDFDGTLASSDGTISQINCDAIKYFISEGGFFTVCTGRSKQGFHSYISEIMNAPIILANGALIYDYNSDKTLFYYGLGKEYISLLRELSESFPFICTEMYSYLHHSYVYNLCAESKNHFDRQFIKYEEISDFEDAEYPLIKVMLYTGNEHVREVQKFLSECDTGLVKFIPSDGSFTELLHRKTDKGQALLQLADILNVSHDFAFAVGDGSNDADMLNAAAVGFVPENGDEYAKLAGDVTVKSNDNGAIADVIEKLEKMYY